MTNDITWSAVNQKGETIADGKFEAKEINLSGLYDVRKVNLDLSKVKDAEKIVINLKIEQTGYKNSYPIWVYPANNEIVKSEEIIITNKLSDDLITKLEEGGSVLLFPDTESVKEKSVGGLFNPDFWNWGMFKSISEWKGTNVSPGTLGILTDPNHPIFNSFPTDFHTNWQWYSIIKTSNPLILNSTEKSYRPIVQVIDNLERNNKLGLIFEFKVGEGKLLVCMAKLDDLLNKPEAKQLYRSIISYMNSAHFAPLAIADKELLSKILGI